MNSLLLTKIHSNPYFINRFYVRCAGSVISGILLEYLINQFNKNGKNSIIISKREILTQTDLFEEELLQALKKLKKLPFLQLNQNTENFIFQLDDKKFNEFVGVLK